MPRFRGMRTRGSSRSGTNACAGDPLEGLDVAARGLDAHLVGDGRDGAVALEAERRRASGARTPCRTTRGLRPRRSARRSCRENQKRDESGVWISSMTTISPLAVLAELVLGVDEDEARARAPRAGRTRRAPRRISAARSKSSRVDVAHGEDLFARGGDVVIALRRLGAGREDRRGELSFFLQAVGQAVPAEDALACW